MNYSNLKSSERTHTTSGGYKPVLFFAPISAIATFARPVVSATPLPGESVTIKTAHTFADGKAATRWELKLHSATHNSKPIGDEGAQDLEHTAEVMVLGDDAIILEAVQNLLNDQIVIFLKDSDCSISDNYVQIGDDCVPATVTPEFTGKTTKDGKKEYKITFTSKKKFFYSAALDIQA